MTQIVIKDCDKYCKYADLKGNSLMRGDNIRYAMDHAKPELARAIWNDFYTNKKGEIE